MNFASRFRVVKSAIFISIVCSCFLDGATIVSAADTAPPDPAKCHLTAMVTADNDIRLDGDRRSPGKPAVVPPAVADRIHAAAAKLFADLPPDGLEGLTCKDLFPHTYSISAPQHRELYVVEVASVTGIDYFYLVLYDPATGAVTQNPQRIWAKWTQGFSAKDPLLKTPYVSFADLLNNHHDQIVFEERVHNGSMYNAVVYRYFELGQDLALTLVLARETRLLALEGDGLFVRDLTQLSDTRLRLDTSATSLKDLASRKEQGYVILESSGSNAPLHVAESHLDNPHGFDCLVTCDPNSKGDDVFLSGGNTFRY